MATARPQVFVVDRKNIPVSAGKYAFHQGDITEQGQLEPTGRAPYSRIDPARPFLFEIRDRACAIRDGAFFNPDDPRIEYGGTWFDWRLVRDDVNPDKRFWTHYRKEMDEGHRNGVDLFMQHEHVTRRPIQCAKRVLLQHGKLIVRATPVEIRVGPFVRYADHERAVIWFETATPAMVRIRIRRSGTQAETRHYASTVRAGGRYFAAVQVEGLSGGTFYDYTAELAPLPATGLVPVTQPELKAAFPTLESAVADSVRKQLTSISIGKTEWLAFRTLERKYETRLRFATGSCRWYPGDTDHKGKAWGPDMLKGLGQWLTDTAKDRDRWPHFLFFGGDQIYSDEIGLAHGARLRTARFAARVPGPADGNPLRDKLVDGAWAGRFAHRFQPYKDPAPAFAATIGTGLENADKLYELFPDLKDIYREYPDISRREALSRRHRSLKNRRENTGAKLTKAPDEIKAERTLAHLGKAEALEASVEPWRAISEHWKAAPRNAPWRNPMSADFLVHNFALWSIPDFERDLPKVSVQAGLTTIRRPDGRGHPPAERGVHAADFAEYAFLYERAGTSATAVRTLLAHVPTFLMFDDHEATDDWNFDTAWVRMLHNEQDDARMWPKTLTDALAAYWMYQGWCNKAPSQWPASDPRAAALAEAMRAGTDALPRLRLAIHRACFTPIPSKDANASYQTGLTLDWHYRLPFDPPFLVPDCRTRRLMVPADERLRTIDHGNASKAPKSQTIDDKQLAWLRGVLVDSWRGGPVAFIAPSTPLLMQKKVMSFMTQPEIAAGGWARGDLAGLGSAIFDSTAIGIASDALLRVFRKGKDLEHMIRDKSWRDLWRLVDDMHAAGSPVKTLVLVSGDVHHSYSMTGNRASSGRPRPEVVQVTCSGLQTTIRKDFKVTIAEKLSSLPFDMAGRRLVPGFVAKDGTGAPDLVLYENAVALVDVALGPEVEVAVTYLTMTAANKRERHVFSYSSGPAYMMNGEPAVMAKYRKRAG